MNDRNLRLFTIFAVAGIAPLMVTMNLVVSALDVETMGSGLLPPDARQYLALLPLVIALVLWHRRPGGSWPWLLLAGTVFSIPVLLKAMGMPLHVSGITQDVVTILVQSAPSMSLVGVLGAANWLHQRGRPASGAALMGTALLSQMVGSAVLLTAGFDAVSFSRVVTIGLFVVGAAGAIGAVMLNLREPIAEIDRPAVRTTVLGALGAVSPVVLLVWRPSLLDDAADRDSYFLQVGFVLLVIGLVLGGLGGPRLLLGAAASGLLIGPFGMLVAPSVEVLDQFPVLAIGAVLVTTVIAYVLASSPLRLYFAVGGLTVLAAGLVLLFVLFNADDPLRPSDTFDQVFTPILVVIGIVAVCCALAGTGAAMAREAASPAVLAGLSTPFALGTIAIIADFTAHPPAGKARIVGMLPPVIVCVLIAVTLLAVLARAATRRAAPVSV